MGTGMEWVLPVGGPQTKTADARGGSKKIWYGAQESRSGLNRGHREAGSMGQGYEPRWTGTTVR